jgi:DNA-binding CsgD family transcriptional regulator
MSKSAHLRVQDIRAIFQMAGECRELGDDPEAWRQHLVRRLARLVGAGLVLTGEQAGCRAGRIQHLGVATWGWENGFNQDVFLRPAASLADDPTSLPVMNRYLERLRGSDGVCLTRTDLVPDKDWHRSLECQEVARPMGFDHTLWCYLSLLGGAGDEFAGTILYRTAREGDFSLRDRALVREAHAAIAPQIGGPLARFGDPSPANLAPRVRQVLRCLLEGDGDKQIAAWLGLTRHTVNQYAKTIFRHFGVQSRAELLARWLRRGFPARFAWDEE